MGTGGPGAAPPDPKAALARLAEDYRTIDGELKHYSRELARKPRTVVLSKVDLVPAAEAEEAARRLSRAIGLPVRPLSAVTGLGLGDLLQELDVKVREAKVAEGSDAAGRVDRTGEPGTGNEG